MSIELALHDDSRAIANALHRLVRDLEASTQPAAAAITRQLDTLRQRVEAALDTDRVRGLVAERLGAVAQALDAPKLADPDAWASFYAQLSEAYDALAAALRRDAIPVPRLRPPNRARMFFHVLSASICVFLAAVVFTPKQLPFVTGAFALWAWSLEALRRLRPELNGKLMAFFGPIAHAHESEVVNSSTWYMTALVVLTLPHSPLVAIVGVTVLGFADPAASLVGRRFGRLQLVHGRTLEGTAAFVVVGTLAVYAVIAIVGFDIAPGVAWTIAGAASLVGGLAELFSRRVDDNFSVPVSAAVAAGLVLYLAGISGL